MGFTWEFDCHLYYRRANALALSLRTTSPAVLGEILNAWFDGEPSGEHDDVANIRHVDEIA